MADKTQTLGKIAAGLLLTCGSVGLLIHRMPRMTYVKAHEDKPRPVEPGQAEARATANAVKPPLPKILARKTPTPAAPAEQNVAQASANAPEQENSSAAAESDPAVDWMDSCSAEIGLLCYNVPERKLKRCLGEYQDALRKVCSEALYPEASSDNP